MSANPQIGEWLDRIKSVNIHDVAEFLSLKPAKNGGSGDNRLYFRPNEKNPSLSLYNARQFKDHATGQSGSCIDLVIYAGKAFEVIDAAKQIGEWFGIPMPKPEHKDQGKKSLAETLAGICSKNPEPAVPYLTGRGISETVVREAIKHKTVGFNDYTSAKIPAGERGHGGAAVAFIVRHLNRVAAVDFRYLDAALNGGQKTGCQGEKNGVIWTSSRERFKRAKKVYIVESPINALSVETAYEGDPQAPYICALAIRGVNNTDLDWSFMRGKSAIIATDMSDGVNEQTGKRAGMEAAYRLYDALTACDVSARMVNMIDWNEGEDINDVLNVWHPQELKRRLAILDDALIPGQPNVGKEVEKSVARRRVFLPSQDFRVYWKYRTTDDFMQYVKEVRVTHDDEGDDKEVELFDDLCSFRVAAMSRLTIQSHMSTINGTQDNQSETVFGISCQTPRNGPILQREVINADKIYNVDWWKSRFGHIWAPSVFARMITIMERSAGLAAREVVNFIGVAWRDGKLAALEGPDCFFTEPQKQCLYYNMTFPRGYPSHAATIVEAYQATFKNNAACIALVWTLGAHLKNILSFYPHFQMQAEKGSGKSKLLDSLQTTCAFQILSGQMLKTDHRRRASVSYTTHPVGWDEFSKLPKTVLGDIDGLLQSTYRFEFTRVGAALTPYLMCAPVLLAGEEVDVQSLQSKICRSTLSVAKQGDLISHRLPQFPLRQWLDFIASADPERVREVHAQYVNLCLSRSKLEAKDATAKRMCENYAAILTAWRLLCEFADIDVHQGDFIQDLIIEMNQHMSDTDGTRLPWVWIMEILCSELDANRFEHPYLWETVTNEDGVETLCLILRTSHIMDHISTANHLRDKYNHLPIKTARVFRNQLMNSGVVWRDDIERSIRGRRYAHMTAISLAELEKLGLYASPKLNDDDHHGKTIGAGYVKR